MIDFVTIEAVKQSYKLGLSEVERFDKIKKFINNLKCNSSGISDLIDTHSYEKNAAFHLNKNSTYFRLLGEIGKHQIPPLVKSIDKPMKRIEYFNEAISEFIDAIDIARSELLP